MAERLEDAKAAAAKAKQLAREKAADAQELARQKKEEALEAHRRRQAKAEERREEQRELEAWAMKMSSDDSSDSSSDDDSDTTATDSRPATPLLMQRRLQERLQSPSVDEGSVASSAAESEEESDDEAELRFSWGAAMAELRPMQTKADLRAAHQVSLELAIKVNAAKRAGETAGMDTLLGKLARSRSDVWRMGPHVVSKELVLETFEEALAVPAPNSNWEKPLFFMAAARARMAMADLHGALVLLEWMMENMSESSHRHEMLLLAASIMRRVGREKDALRAMDQLLLIPAMERNQPPGAFSEREIAVQISWTWELFLPRLRADETASSAAIEIGESEVVERRTRAFKQARALGPKLNPHTAYGAGCVLAALHVDEASWWASPSTWYCRGLMFANAKQDMLALDCFEEGFRRASERYAMSEVGRPASPTQPLNLARETQLRTVAVLSAVRAGNAVLTDYFARLLLDSNPGLQYIRGDQLALLRVCTAGGDDGVLRASEHRAASLVVAAAVRWKERRQQTLAALAIQRKHYAHRQRRWARERQQKKSSAATRVQCVFRGRRERQQVWRFTARRKAQGLRRQHSARNIQRNYRRHLRHLEADVESQARRWLMEEERWLAEQRPLALPHVVAFMRMCVARNRFRRVRAKVIRLQCCFRGFLARLHVYRLRVHRETAAAMRRDLANMSRGGVTSKVRPSPASGQKRGRRKKRRRKRNASSHEKGRGTGTDGLPAAWARAESEAKERALREVMKSRRRARRPKTLAGGDPEGSSDDEVLERNLRKEDMNHRARALLDALGTGSGRDGSESPSRSRLAASPTTWQQIDSLSSTQSLPSLRRRQRRGRGVEGRGSGRLRRGRSVGTDAVTSPSATFGGGSISALLSQARSPGPVRVASRHNGNKSPVCISSIDRMLDRKLRAVASQGAAQLLKGVRFTPRGAAEKSTR